MTTAPTTKTPADFLREMREADVAVAQRRLRRAENDLAKAEAAWDRVCGYKSSTFTSHEELGAMRARAEDRVMTMRGRVAARRQILDSAVNRWQGT